MLTANNNMPDNYGKQPFSDQVLIEIVHSIKDIIIEFIDKHYSHLE